MSIRFSCPKCGTAFTLDDSAAGKTGRCKKCRHTMIVPAKPPPQPEVVASGMYRLGAVASPASELGLVPISEDFRKPVDESQKAKAQDEYDDPSSYQLESLPDLAALVRLEQPPLVKRVYRQQMRTGLGLLRKLSDLAYLLCWPFLLLILFGAATDHRSLAVLGAVGVVLLSLARVAIEGFFLITFNFKDNPIEGLLFFVPPITFYYLFKRWNIVKETAARLVAPVLLVAAVILAFAYVPTLASTDVDDSAPIGDRIKAETEKLKQDVESALDDGGDTAGDTHGDDT